LTGELLAKMAGVRFLYVPYKGDATSVTALLGDEINFIIQPTAPALPPRAAVRRLHEELQRTLQVPEVSARLEQIGGEARGSTPEEMRARVAAELQRWSRVMREAGIQPQ